MSHEGLAPTVDRRTFLKAGVTLAGSLVIDFALLLGPCPALAQTAASSQFAPNAFIRVDRHNVVTLVMPSVEMGQGVYTAMAMLRLTTRSTQTRFCTSRRRGCRQR